MVIKVRHWRHVSANFYSALNCFFFLPSLKPERVLHQNEQPEPTKSTSSSVCDMQTDEAARHKLPVLVSMKLLRISRQLELLNPNVIAVYIFIFSFINWF